MKKNILNIALIVLCGAIMGIFMFTVDGPQVVLNALKTAKPIHLILAATCMLAYWVLEASAFHSICKGLKSKISYRDCFQTSMVGQMFNCITPFASGGQPVQAYRLTKCGMPLGQASCALLAKFIVYQIVLTVYTLVVIVFKLPFFMSEVPGFSLVVFIGFAANTIVMAAILGIGFAPKTTKKILIAIARFCHKVKLVKSPDKLYEKIEVETERFYSEFAVLKSNPKAMILPALLTVVQLTAFFTVPYFVCLSLSATSIKYGTVVCAAAFVLLVSSFVPLPGGSGGAEGGFYLFFGMFFVQTGILSVAIVLWRVMTFYLPILAGLIFSKLPIGSLNVRKKKQLVPSTL